MINVWAWSLTATLIVGVVSLIGVVILYLSVKEIHKLIFFLISLAVGALFGDAFIHLIPEIYREQPGSLLPSAGFLIGILVFFLLEKFLHSHHHRHFGSDSEHRHINDDDEHEVKALGPIILIADATHNFIDGTLIAASFMASREIGIATTIAVLLHEIPHEIGDYGVLIHAGYTRLQALMFNFLTALVALVGAFAALAIGGNSMASFTHWILPIATGGFIYIAGSDLVPELHKDNRLSTSVIQLIAISIGIALMLALLLVG